MPCGSLRQYGYYAHCAGYVRDVSYGRYAHTTSVAYILTGNQFPQKLIERIELIPRDIFNVCSLTSIF